MKITHLFIVLAILSTSMISCEKISKEDIKEVFECVFTQVDDDLDGLIDLDEKQLMQDCDDNAYNSISDIEKNLIGHWILVGHGEYWSPAASQPCAYIIFEENELTYKLENNQIDTIITTPFTIEQSTSSSSFHDFSLKTEDIFYEGLNLGTFSPNFMYGNYTPIDGNMYIYKKVK